MSFLEILASYRASRSQILREKSNSPVPITLTAHFTEEELAELVRQQQLSGFISQCSYAMEALGVREGEPIEEKYLNTLSDREKYIFHARYTNRNNYHEIANSLGLSSSEVEQIYKRSLRKIKKTIISYCEL